MATIEQIQLYIDRMQELYPETFPRKPHPKVPLAVNIHQQLEAHSELGYNKKLIRQALAMWCQGTRYWNAVMKPFAVRYNLDGSESTSVTYHQQAYARYQLKEAARRKTANEYLGGQEAKAWYLWTQ